MLIERDFFMKKYKSIHNIMSYVESTYRINILVYGCVI